MYPIPANATRIRYLESTGTQYIDTGLNADDGLGCDMSMAFPDASMNINYTFGVLKRTGGTPPYVRYHASFTQDYSSLNLYLGDGTVISAGVAASPGTNDFHRFVYDPQTQTASVDNASGSTSALGTWDTGMDFPLFGRQDSNGTLGLNRIRVRYAKFYRNGSLVQDLVPLRIGSVGYLFDRVSGTLFGNDGAGDFVLGPDTFATGVVPTRMMAMGVRKPYVLVDWIQGDGASCVETKFVLPSVDTRVSLVASASSAQANPIVCAGQKDVSGAAADYGWRFFAKYNDRQLTFAFGKQRWWNSSGNQGNWADGSFHTIAWYKPTSSVSAAPVATKDGTSYTIENEGSTSSKSIVLPSSSVTFFAFNGLNGGDYSNFNFVTKVRSCSFTSAGGDLLADFRAARSGTVYGVVDLVTNTFFPQAGTGTLSHGDDLT